MKLADIPRRYPDIFVTLSLEQQSAALLESGYMAALPSPLTGFSIEESRHYQDIYSFSGFSARELRGVSRTIHYHGQGITIIIDC